MSSKHYSNKMLEDNTAAAAAADTAAVAATVTAPHQCCSDMSEVTCIDQLKNFYIDRQKIKPTECKCCCNFIIVIIDDSIVLNCIDGRSRVSNLCRHHFSNERKLLYWICRSITYTT